MASRSSLLGALLLTAALPATANADIYECRGADGSTHYTNVRPQGAAGRRCRLMYRDTTPPPSAGAADRPGLQGPRPEAPPHVHDPYRYQRYDAHILEAARLYQLPVSFIRAVIKVESDFNPNVVSRAGAMGLMQLMPRTASNMGVQNPFDPRQNILGGVRYLRVLANMFNGDLVLTVAAYNAGEGAVSRHQGVPPYEETRRYVGRVLTWYYSFRSTQTAQR